MAPGDNFDLETSHVIPALIRKFIEAQARGERQVVLWGDGSPSREFLYVDDAGRAILLAAEHYNGRDPVNIGTGVEITIEALATMVAKETGFEGEVVWDTTKPNGQPRRCLEVDRAKQYFGFEANELLREGINKTVAWYRFHQTTVREVVF